MALDVAIVGATGMVGATLLQVLADRDFPVGRLLPLASARSVGSTVRFRGQDIPVQEATPEAFEGIDIVFFAATGSLSRTLAPEAAARGALVIDKSSTWRMDPRVPLVVPEVNPTRARPDSGIISCPNCTTIGLVVALQPLRGLANIRRVIVTSFQAVSGTGKEAVEEMQAQRALGPQAPEPTIYAHRVYGNVLPYAETLTDNSYTSEEMKLLNETRKILGDDRIDVTMTCCRVPVEVGHSLSVLVEFDVPVPPAAARAALSAAPGVTLMDGPHNRDLPTPLDVAGRDDVLVGRVRSDLSNPNGLWLWVVSDNLRKGASTNAVQIAEAVFLRG